MRNILFILGFAVFIFSCSDNQAEHNHDSNSKVANDSSKKSIPSEVKKWVGNTDIKINYYSPGVRGRVIWGGLVPYDQVWVTGAHSATTLEVGKAFHIGDKILPAGKYAIFTIPGKEEWTVIINKNWNQHLTDDYSEKDDLARIKVKPQTTEEMTERLKYEIDQTGERIADIIISWEKIRVRFGIEIR
ncbi:MAG: DUF2911 domain-containing protein [Flavisolibacter sp.]